MPISKIIMIASLQLAYTSLFGYFATYMLLKTGNISGSIVSHSFCNFMGLPDFDISRSDWLKTLTFAALYLIGVFSFIYFILKI
jgi:prenyl protein peptidase